MIFSLVQGRRHDCRAAKTVFPPLHLDKRPPTCLMAQPHNHRDTAVMRFEGTSAYVATDDLKVAVNAANHAPSARSWSKASRAPARPCWRSEDRQGARRAAE